MKYYYLVDLRNSATKCNNCNNDVGGILPAIVQEMDGYYLPIERFVIPCESCGSDLNKNGIKINETTEKRKLTKQQDELLIAQKFRHL